MQSPQPTTPPPSPNEKVHSSLLHAFTPKFVPLQKAMVTHKIQFHSQPVLLSPLPSHKCFALPLNSCFPQVTIYLHDLSLHTSDTPLNVFDTAERLSATHGIGVYLTSSPINLAETISSLNTHPSLAHFHTLNFHYSSVSYSSDHPSADPHLSSFYCVLFHHQSTNIASIWAPQPSTTIPKPTCYLHHISIPPLRRELQRLIPSFLSHPNKSALPLSFYSFIFESLQLPPPSASEHHILYEANPTHYISFAAGLYHEFICLSSTTIQEAQLTSLSTWLLHFLVHFLDESELSGICGFYNAISNPGFQAYLPPPSPTPSLSHPCKKSLI